LALKGYFPMEQQETLNQPGTNLPSHCDRNLTVGVDMTTGSLGQGVSTGIGMALAQKLDGKSSRTYIFVGDGESDEGQVWEGMTFAAHYKLDNLVLFFDYNGKQLDGYTKDVMDVRDLRAKAESFGWNAVSIDGHDVEAIAKALEDARTVKDVPTCIVLNTVKGKGAPELEEILLNHHSAISEEFGANALASLEKDLAEIEKELNE
jgi:transketolase